ncbi:unnamed protein product (macronuclear) [Paramecium tetraurelia]|uniref:Uncharacterized protein n=1 Tax=Paramecium tetraurelia TaxID=5888 RepID=A0CLP5_PARTE|nr:uncharacterized protein GSPATT00008261001 [Paramecium tetraurelia]CAK71712.1 unnamed protein product [Paramecium tetraurelia]|eukprot:XP_001439109.1 hypothetical protein (macronuclear) [Paramecium tetraurelia strain d4-2]
MKSAITLVTIITIDIAKQMELLKKTDTQLYGNLRWHSVCLIDRRLVYMNCKIFSLGYDFRRPFWNLIITNIQLARKKCKLEIRNFDDDISLSDCNLELLKFIQYFIDTLLRANQEELVEMMQQLLPQQQSEIMGLLQNQINDIGSFQECGYFEHQTTNTIISLEENINTKDNIIAQQNKQFELMKTEYQSKIIDQQNKITQLNELYEQLYDSELFCLQKLNCCDFEEVFNKFEEYIKEIEKCKQSIEDLNQVVQNQQKEIAKLQQKNQTLKSQLLSCPPTARSIEPEQQQILVKDPKEQKTIENLKAKNQKLIEDNKKKLEWKEFQYEVELKKLKGQLYESEKQAASFKKKMEMFKFELEEYQNMNQYERKQPFESLRHQGVYSSNNSYILEIDQRFGQSPKSTCFDFFQSQNKSVIDHAISHNNQSLKYTDETNVTKLQLQLIEKSKQITLLEKQLSCYQQSSHSRRNSMAKQLERHQDQQVNQEQLKYYMQQSEQRDREINEIREQQNSNFIDLCKQLIKQNEQIQKLNSIILKNKSSDQMQEMREKHQNDLQALNQYYVDALNNKDEQLHLIISLFYDAVK